MSDDQFAPGEYIWHEGEKLLITHRSKCVEHCKGKRFVRVRYPDGRVGILIPDELNR